MNLLDLCKRIPQRIFKILAQLIKFTPVKYFYRLYAMRWRIIDNIRDEAFQEQGIAHLRLNRHFRNIHNSFRSHECCKDLIQHLLNMFIVFALSYSCDGVFDLNLNIPL